MLSKFKHTLSRHLSNLPGWRTNRKIVVIESDDWGSIRMPSKGVYEKLLKAGIRVDRCPYNRYDSLASEKDLSTLFEVLTKFRDKNGNHPVITANTVVANPDFEKINASHFKKYFFEPFTETLKKYPNHKNSFLLWKEGIESNIFHPQFHGREHVNISLWLSLLHENNETFRLAFDFGLWGLGPEIVNIGKINIQASFDALVKSEIENHKSAIKEGLALFEKIFGYCSKSFIANNFIWDSSLNPFLSEKEINTIQGMKYQLLPVLDSKKRKKIFRYIGQTNIHKQVNLVRNCVFEPTQMPQIDSVSFCLRGIENAFFYKKPAIISSHRLNFIGEIVQKNRTTNLVQLKNLLSQILMSWPDVEFLTSDQLGSIMLANKGFEQV